MSRCAAIGGLPYKITQEKARNRDHDAELSSEQWRGLVGPRYARLSATTISKHKHLMIKWCLCFRIVVTLMTPIAGRRPTSPQRDSAVFVSFVPFVVFVFAVSPFIATGA